MECEKCGLEMEIQSQIFIKKEGDKINTRTPMVWKCPNNHYQYEKYDNLK